MRKLFFFILLALLFSVNAVAQGVQMRNLFASMPDSLLPMMTKNNRLDCIDFIENDMEAKVRNRLDDYVELKTLTQDYLLLQTSEQSRVEMRYVAKGDTTGIVYLVRTYYGPAGDSSIECYDQDWRVVKMAVVRPEVEAFFKTASATDADTLRQIVRELKDLTLLEASLSADRATLTWKIALDELSVGDKKVAKQYVQDVMTALP